MKNLRVEIKSNKKKPARKSTKTSSSKNRIEELNEINTKEKKKSNRTKILKRFIILLILVTACFGGYKVYGRWERLQEFNKSKVENNSSGEKVQVCDNILNPKCWGEALSPKLEQDNNVTGVLIVGLDSRAEGSAHDGLMNTDSILVALFDHETKKTTLISLPRDLYVPYYVNSKGPFYAKINAIYATGEARNDVEDGFDLLEENVERIIGKKIQYRVIVKLKGVEDGVNAVGGITIDVPTSLRVRYPNDYPGKNGKPNTEWLYYDFEPGIQEMDGEHALVWARFRQVVKGDMNYASDFSRGERQQQVLDALKEKALNEDGSTLDKAKKYWNILQSINKNVEANIGLEEIFAGLSLASSADTNPINIIFDPNFGGLNQIIFHPPTEETGGYMIKFKDNTFKTAQNYLDLIWEYPKLYDENAKILVINQIGRSYNNTDKAILFRNDIQSNKLPVTTNNLVMITEKKATESQGVIIVDMTGGAKSGTTKYLAEYFGATKIIEDPANYGMTQSNYKEDIKIIITPEVVTE